MIATDIFVEANPALGSAVLHSFCNGHFDISQSHAEFPVLFLALPLCLPSGMDQYFEGTSKKTGILEWLHRHPEILSGLAERVSNTVDVTRAAIQFGLQYNILELTPEGRFAGSKKGFAKPLKYHGASVVGNVLSKAYRLGSWVGLNDSAALTFNIIGIQP